MLGSEFFWFSLQMRCPFKASHTILSWWFLLGITRNVLMHLHNGCVNNADLWMISRKQLRCWNRVPMIDSFEPHFNLKSYTSTFLASCSFRDMASCLCPVIDRSFRFRRNETIWTIRSWNMCYNTAKCYCAVDPCLEVLQHAYCHYWLHRGNLHRIYHLHRVYRLSARDLFGISILHTVIVSRKIHCHFCH
jgi:hypothetical protein